VSCGEYLILDKVDCIIIGAGVVGLAIARAVALTGREVLVLESNEAVGMETSSRNSEVIHAGLYYKAGSLKANLCVRGKQMLYQYCSERNIRHRRLGKLIVATTSGQTETLSRYQQQAWSNGVKDLQRIKSDQLAELEPDVQGFEALWSPSTGIIDSHSYMLSLHGDINNAGGIVVFHASVTSARAVAAGLILTVESDVPFEIEAPTVINCAGLSAINLASRLGVPKKNLPSEYFAKGHYYTLSGRAPFSHLVYPLADDAGLGVHVTLDLAGQVRFGPDVEWVERINYDFCDSRKEKFIEAIQAYYPDLTPSRLQQGYVGIRPKVVGSGAPPGDFLIHGKEEHGVNGLICLYGIESPGLTASLSLADYVLHRAH
jgi:L-2-hydroxyglutarate oxidase LhgO